MQKGLVEHWWSPISRLSSSHVDRQQSLGLYGAMIIDPARAADETKADKEYTIQLKEWLMSEGLIYPAMPMDRGMPNFFTINCRAYPETDTIHMKVGENVKVRFVGSNTGFIRPMHIRGGRSPSLQETRRRSRRLPATRLTPSTLRPAT